MVKSVRACKEWRDDPNFTNFPTSTWTKLLKWGFVIVWLPKVKFIKLTILIESIFFKNDIHHNFQTIYHALDAWVNSTCTIFPSDETCWPLVTGPCHQADHPTTDHLHLVTITTDHRHLSRHVRCWLWMLGLPPPLLLAVFFRFFPREFSFPSFSFQIGFFPLLGRNFLCLNFSLHILIVNFFCIFNIFPRLTSTSVEFIFLFPVQKRMVLSETPK